MDLFQSYQIRTSPLAPRACWMLDAIAISRGPPQPAAAVRSGDLEDIGGSVAVEAQGRQAVTAAKGPLSCRLGRAC